MTIWNYGTERLEKFHNKRLDLLVTRRGYLEVSNLLGVVSYHIKRLGERGNYYFSSNEP